MGFMDDFLSSSKARKDPATKYCIESNRWDVSTRKEIESQVKDYVIATNRLTESVDTGYEAMSDTVMSLFKAVPRLRDPGDIRPSYLINRAVMGELAELRELEDARRHSIGDPVATGLAAAELEPELEILFDKLEQAQQQAQNIEGMLQEAEGELQDLDELMAQLAGADDLEEPEAKDWQEQAARIQEHLDALREQIENRTTNLNEQLDMQRPYIKEALQGAMDKVNESNDALAQFDSWGLSPGSIKRMDPRPRMELAKRLKSDKFKRMAEVIGRMQNIAFTSQQQRSDYSMEEVYELEQGDDLARLVPTELLALGDEILVYDFLHRFMERSLVQYALQGTETVQRGGILSLMDSSSSMTGDRQIWSKAISLALLKIAKMQNRQFRAIEFAGPGLYIEYEFDTSRDELMLKRSHAGVDRFFYGAEAILTFAEDGLGGGTCFMTPFGRALDIMEAEHSTTGVTQADIIFLTDGQAGVTEEFMDRFHTERERLGFKTFGIAIGGHCESEPMASLCDGGVVSVQQLTNENDMRPVFGAVGG